MARAVMRQTQPDGSIVVLYDDGSKAVWSSGYGSVLSQEGPNSERARALQSGDQEQIREILDREDARQRDLEDRLYQYNERAYTDSRTDRNADLRYRSDQLGLERDRLGLTRQGQQDDRWYKEQLVQQAMADLGLRTELGRGDLALRSELGRGDLDLRRQQFGLDEAKVGLGLVDRATELGAQPESWTKLNNWYRGTAGQAGTPVFARRILDVANGTAQGGLPAYSTGTEGATPQTNSIAKVIGKLVGDGSIDNRQAAAMLLTGDGGFSEGDGWSPEDVALIRAIGEIGKMGGARAAGVYQTLDKDEKAQIRGGLASLGYSPDHFERDALRGLPGQGNASAA